jgi:hypothetical protein
MFSLNPFPIFIQIPGKQKSALAGQDALQHVTTSDYTCDVASLLDWLDGRDTFPGLDYPYNTAFDLAPECAFGED